ncbi:MAG TPA: DUF1501 domain-containing protein [Phenylobacterium sp.]|nr:DUF1501 domain-containing protein [Phenylobacterium sp.]
MTNSSSRREFLRWSAGFSMLGAAAPLALQLTAAGSAAAAGAPDYKALVCLFLQGGQDSNNLVLATDPDSFGRYTSARNNGQDPIALMAPGTPVPDVPPGTRLDRPALWGGVLPIVPRTAQAIPAGTTVTGARTFAVHPMMAPAVPLFEQGRLAVLANVGMLLQPTTKAQFEGRRVPIPPQLFSHNDQQSSWQAGAIDGAQTGWGGRLGDVLASQNGGASIFTTVSADGNAVFLSGNVVNQYQVNTQGSPAIVINNRSGSLFGSSLGGSTLNSIIQNTGGTSNFANDHATVVQRAISAATSINAAVGVPAAQAIPQPPAFFEPIQGFQDQNPWTVQLHTVAQLIAAAPTLGVKRQVFFCRLDSFDTHDNQNPREALNLARLAQALTYFDSVLSNIGGVDMRANVTTFTASDFSRGFATNGSGTDHAWGGHHLIMGGAVKGGDMYGQYPTLGIDRPDFKNPDISGNNMIPTTSVDQYGATLGRWFGVSDSDMNTVFPRLGNFSQRYLGFL